MFGMFSPVLWFETANPNWLPKQLCDKTDNYSNWLDGILFSCDLWISHSHHRSNIMELNLVFLSRKYEGKISPHFETLSFWTSSLYDIGALVLFNSLNNLLWGVME